MFLVCISASTNKLFAQSLPISQNTRLILLHESPNHFGIMLKSNWATHKFNQSVYSATEMSLFVSRQTIVKMRT